MADSVTSIHGVPIRLTDERWAHIVEHHPEVAPHHSRLLDTIREPNTVLRSGEYTLCAVRQLTAEQHIVVIYREVSQTDGFVITSWLTTRIERILKKEILWTRPSSD